MSNNASTTSSNVSGTYTPNNKYSGHGICGATTSGYANSTITTSNGYLVYNGTNFNNLLVTSTAEINDELESEDKEIFIDGERMPLKDALDIMTDQWLEDGNYSLKTIEDLRNVVRDLVKEKNKYKKELEVFKKTAELEQETKKSVSQLKTYYNDIYNNSKDYKVKTEPLIDSNGTWGGAWVSSQEYASPTTAEILGAFEQKSKTNTEKEPQRPTFPENTHDSDANKISISFLDKVKGIFFVPKQ